ncbi:putative gustatory receptor 59b [Drosophila innubila]|uniref:putative gustatory receptor 59b n=1 Tax=Drosophila innubila TaxID=198719 RepID=UPI00148DDC44|nr:putative gustatory receptor 59b [Drosophila innubila]
MGRQRLLQWYHNYALALGVTSHWLVAGRVQQTWLTRSYTLILNTLELTMLPVLFWLSAEYIEKTNWFPNLVPYTCYILYSVSYATIAYTVISRGRRDCALLELERIVNNIMSQQLHHIGRTLNYIYYLKFTTMIFVCVNSVALCLVMPTDGNLSVYLITFLFQNAMNIPVVATYRYFLALWYIACSYQSINCRLEDLMKSFKSRLPTRLDLDELNRLWSQHLVLGRCTLRINKVYEWLLLAARFDYVTFGVINIYWGMLFMFAIKSPIYMIMLGAFNYWIRLIDFFLLDVMCDLTIQYQNCPHHSVTEGRWFKEINAFLMYVNTSKFNISVCGLYIANRSRWFQMFGSIVSFSILLIQFHLILRKNFSSVAKPLTKTHCGPGVVINAAWSQAQEPCEWPDLHFVSLSPQPAPLPRKFPDNNKGAAS